MAGTLYIVSTPIGNLQDISARAIKVLKDADLIACEDSRHTKKLLSHFGIKTTLSSYHEHNELSKSKKLIEGCSRNMRVKNARKFHISL